MKRLLSCLSLATVAAALPAPLLAQGYGESPYIFGVHEPQTAHHMADKRKGWIVFTEELGRDPNNGGGADYRSWADQGFGVIVRLNHGYDASGTLPYAKHYGDFARRAARFVAASPGAHIWILGNEMNLDREWPRYEGYGEEITPERFVQAFRQVRAAIKALAGHAADQVIPGAIGTYAPPSAGGLSYVQYHARVLELLGSGGLDGIALHTYTHGSDPALVVDESRMGPPYQAYRYHFRAYRDYMNVHPSWARALPVYVTETDQDVAWEDANRGWVKAAYREIDEWNRGTDNQKIRALVLYRSCCDRWDFSGKSAVIADFRQALDNDYRWSQSGALALDAQVRETESAVGGNFAPGETRGVRVRVRNTGGSTWQAGDAVRLGSGSDNNVAWSAQACGGYATGLGDARAFLCRAVAPGESHDFSFSVTAPASGSARLSVRMVKDGDRWFGEAESWTLPVTASAPLAALVLDSTSLPAAILPGETRPVVVRVRNTGSTTWTAGELHRLGTAPGNSVTWSGFACDGFSRGPADARAYLCQSVPPGGTAELSFRVTAPAGGSAVLAVQMVKDGLAWFGDPRRFVIPSTGNACQMGVGADRWKGEYFANRGLSGAPALVRDDGSGGIDFDWGAGTPSGACGIPADGFSARFTRTVAFEAGTHRFTLTVDDGARLYLDGQLRLESWKDQPPTTYTVDVPLAAGNHVMRLDYYENGGGAVARLAWTKLAGGGGTSGSKLTIHTGFTGPLSMAFVRDARPRLVKILDNFGPAAELKAASPGTAVIGRIYDAAQPYDGSPEQRAQEWWARHRDRVLAHPAVDYWEGYNEPDASTTERIAWYARFEAERVRLLAASGRRACIGNFSMGTPDVNNPQAWPAFYPAIDAARANGGILGVHEYGAPMQQYWDEATGEGWLCGRYRKVYRQFLGPAGRVLPLAITETGVDGDVAGWRNAYTGAQYLDQLRWYDGVLRADAYVLGATVFQLEIPSWESFDIAPIIGPFTDHVRSTR